jgi:catechol O-methyltransferase
LGYSAILFADALRSFGQRGVQIFSLELNEQFAAIASKFIELAGFCDLITVVVGPAASSLRALVSSRKLEKVDLLFLDHAEEMYVDDFKVCEGLGLLGRGSVVVADNVVRPGAPLYPFGCHQKHTSSGRNNYFSGGTPKPPLLFTCK